MPYITEVTTNLSSFNRNKPSVYSRTAIGNYAVRSGENITIKGFNLKNSQNSVVTIGGKNNSFTSSSQSTTEITGTVANAATSGKLELYVSDGTNNIYALNNTNNNDSRGKAASLGSDNSNGYNRQPNGLNNNLLTDDVVLDVYEFTTVATPKNGSITDPFMRINPKTGQPGFCFSNAVLYFNMPGYEQTGATTYSHTTFGADNGGYKNGTFSWDANGNAFGIATCTDTGWPAESVSTVLFSRRATSLEKDRNNNPIYWNTQQAYKNAPYQRGLESTTISLTDNQPTDASMYTTDTERVMSPAIATTVSGTTTTLYVAYYDRLTKQIRFRSGTVANDANTIDGALQDIFYRTTKSDTLRGAPDSIYVDGSSKAGRDSDSTTITQDTVTGTTNGRIEIVASKSLGTGYLAAYQNDTTYGPGEHVDIGISGSNVVIAWYDAVNRKLMISWENPSDLKHDTTVATGTLAKSGDWQSNAFPVEDTTGVGLYVKMAVDPAGGIHLAYYNNNGADLKYAYISQADLLEKKVTKVQTVDAYSNTGARPTIDVTRVEDLNVTGHYKYVPYIGYQMNSNLNTTASARVAYPVKFDANGISAGDGADSQDMCTGNWEIKTVPTRNTPIDAKVSAGVWTSGNNKVHTAIPNVTDTFEDQSATKTINAQATGQRAIIWGNGTLYPVISYAVSEEGKLEMAQMK